MPEELHSYRGVSDLMRSPTTSIASTHSYSSPGTASGLPDSAIVFAGSAAGKFAGLATIAGEMEVFVVRRKTSVINVPLKEMPT